MVPENAYRVNAFGIFSYGSRFQPVTKYILVKYILLDRIAELGGSSFLANRRFTLQRRFLASIGRNARDYPASIVGPIDAKLRENFDTGSNLEPREPFAIRRSIRRSVRRSLLPSKLDDEQQAERGTQRVHPRWIRTIHFAARYDCFSTVKFVERS